MGLERYHRENLNYRHKRRVHRRFFFFFLFLIVLGVIFFTTFSDGGSIVGNVIGTNVQSAENLMKISSSLSIPDVSLKGNYEEISISLPEGQFAYMDNKRIPLEEPENKIILKDFKGNIDLSEDLIRAFSGKVSELRINGVPIHLEGEGTLKFSISSNSSYNSFILSEGINLKEVFFISSGEVYLEEDTLKLNSEKITLENYLGGLKIENKKINFDGFVGRVIVEGSSRKIILSNK